MFALGFLCGFVSGPLLLTLVSWWYDHRNAKRWRNETKMVEIRDPAEGPIDVPQKWLHAGRKQKLEPTDAEDDVYRGQG